MRPASSPLASAPGTAFRFPEQAAAPNAIPATNSRLRMFIAREAYRRLDPHGKRARVGRRCSDAQRNKPERALEAPRGPRGPPHRRGQNKRSCLRRVPTLPMLAMTNENRYWFSLRVPKASLRTCILNAQQSALYVICALPYCRVCVR